jgi:hypothetical protein
MSVLRGALDEPQNIELILVLLLSEIAPVIMVAALPKRLHANIRLTPDCMRR